MNATYSNRRVIFLGLASVLGLVVSIPSRASSHREAPFITEMPKVDGTDFYMFKSYEPGRQDFVTIVANYLPLQDPYGGPNYFSLDPNARYEILIDNNGDAVEDIVFRFQFANTLNDIVVPVGGVDVSIPLINAGMIGPAAGDTGALNIIETYTVTLVRGSSSASITNAVGGSDVFRKPVDNIGIKSIPSYDSYARDHIYTINIPGVATPGRMFVGQRKDPFVVNLGETFDLVNLNPLGAENGQTDSLADKNVTSLILELPVSALTNGLEPVIGAWTTASLPRARILTPNPTFDKPATEQGTYVQVSRLGMPLVNEVVIGLKDKDRFNASRPSGDAQFGVYVTNPTLPVLLNLLFGVTPPCLPRNDLVETFLTGLTGFNQPANVTPAEMLRLNTLFSPTPKGFQNRLGALGGDIAGFPNGRRPGDDVVDIELRVVMGALYSDAGDPKGCAPQGNLAFTDGASVDDSMFDETFPYLRTPLPGSPK